MSHTDYAGARLANAVALFLQKRDESALAGLKIVYGEYLAAEQKNREAQAANDLQDGDQ